ncbi:MAG: cytochrome c oxidase subunit 3 [Chloroflexi bacterium]|nr:cytochrome c oxidase subunit 3 [Chloroflexota bacterium]
MTQHVPNVNHRFNSLTINRLGLWLFLVSDASFFIALITSRFFVEGTSRPDHVNQALGLGLTVLLLLSSLTAYRAEAAAEHGDRKQAQKMLLATIAMGVIFIVGVAFEWYEALQHFPPSTGFGTILFTLTGVHVTHVATGVLALGFVYFQVRRSESDADSQWAVEGAVKWWHFVDVAWVFIYPTLYLVG